MQSTDKRQARATLSQDLSSWEFPAVSVVVPKRYENTTFVESPSYIEGYNTYTGLTIGV